MFDFCIKCTIKESGVVAAIAWAAVVATDVPSILLAFAAGGVIYVRNIGTGEYHGVLIGHGGVSTITSFFAVHVEHKYPPSQKINALTVHPVSPEILASASHDHSVRIYNLSERMPVKFDNPSWPGSKVPVMAGPAFGIRASEGEGDGCGVCFAILCGGPSGGHRAAVLDLVGTCQLCVLLLR